MCFYLLQYSYHSWALTACWWLSHSFSYSYFFYGENDLKRRKHWRKRFRISYLNNSSISSMYQSEKDCKGESWFTVCTHQSSRTKNPRCFHHAFFIITIIISSSDIYTKTKMIKYGTRHHPTHHCITNLSHLISTSNIPQDMGRYVDLQIL